MKSPQSPWTRGRPPFLQRFALSRTFQIITAIFCIRVKIQNQTKLIWVCFYYDQKIKIMYKKAAITH